MNHEEIKELRSRSVTKLFGHLNPTPEQVATLTKLADKCFKQTGLFNTFVHKDDFGMRSHFELDERNAEPFVFCVYLEGKLAYRFKLDNDGSIDWAPGIIGFIRDQQI